MSMLLYIYMYIHTSHRMYSSIFFQNCFVRTKPEEPERSQAHIYIYINIYIYIYVYYIYKYDGKCFRSSNLQYLYSSARSMHMLRGLRFLEEVGVVDKPGTNVAHTTRAKTPKQVSQGSDSARNRTEQRRKMMEPAGQPSVRTSCFCVSLSLSSLSLARARARSHSVTVHLGASASLGSCLVLDGMGWGRWHGVEKGGRTAGISGLQASSEIPC